MSELTSILQLVSSLRGDMSKEAFTPIAPGMSPMETEQALMAAQQGGEMPPEAGMIPPGAEGMPPEAGMMPPGAEGGMPPGGEDPIQMLYDVVVQAVRQVIQETDFGGSEEKQKQPSTKERLENLEAKFDEMMGMLAGGGAGAPPPPPPEAVGGFGPGSGEAAPPPMGPLDPAAHQAMGKAGGSTHSYTEEGFRIRDLFAGADS